MAPHRLRNFIGIPCLRGEAASSHPRAQLADGGVLVGGYGSVAMFGVAMLGTVVFVNEVTLVRRYAADRR
jgi:hypothetical protein